MSADQISDDEIPKAMQDEVFANAQHTVSLMISTAQNSLTNENGNTDVVEVKTDIVYIHVKGI